MRALVVDDSRTTRAILRRILENVGFSEVHEAEDGVAALDLLRAVARPSLALVDWNMPEMNGYDLVKIIRMRRDFDDLKLMMVTTESEAERIVAALEAGADEYVMKPFTEPIIRDKLALLGLPAIRGSSSEAP
ncbi:MAG TPA: response regulator [Sandaracinaceae bacterium LLY-WYZ-13_1]|nr:response regulator [Sandaracinaceae bacterium LLY-WYZ-13_1]